MHSGARRALAAIAPGLCAALVVACGTGATPDVPQRLEAATPDVPQRLVEATPASAPASASATDREQQPDSGPRTPRRATTDCVVTRIVDGDTIHCDGIGSVRFIGIDTPERDQRPFGAAATEALRAMIPVGTRAQLERDVTAKDRYDRTLAYVWHGGQMVNWRMVRSGWALLATYPPDVQWVDSLRVAEQRARRDSVGLWRVNGFACTPADHRREAC